MNKKGEFDEFSYIYLVIFIFILFMLVSTIFSFLNVIAAKSACESIGLEYNIHSNGNCFKLEGNRIITYKTERIGFLKFKVNKFASVPD